MKNTRASEWSRSKQWLLLSERRERRRTPNCAELGERIRRSAWTHSCQPQRIIGDLLTAEINEKQARSIKYQLLIAELPLAKAPINETLVRDLRQRIPRPTA
jgi:hypothetical protein